MVLSRIIANKFRRTASTEDGGTQRLEEGAPTAWLVVGLGNPGPAYSGNRHNIGHLCINRLARHLGVRMRSFRLYAIGEGTTAGQQTVLCKPRTYVNRSGNAVAALLKQYNLQPSRLLVICDDLNLPEGKLRLRPAGSHGGHNGLRSIISVLGQNDFPRLRIGIGRPVINGVPVTDPDLIATYVLSDPAEAGKQTLDRATSEALNVVTTVVGQGLANAMDRFNR